MPLTLDSNENTPKLKKVDFNPFNGPKLAKAIPTTQSQLEIWLSCIIGGEDANRSYNESVSLNLKGLLDNRAIVHALEELINRHEVLRSTFSNDGRLMCIHESFPLNLELIDISDLSVAERDVYTQDMYRKDADKSFDLQNGPLFRTYLVKLSEDNHILKLSAHHIICDGWSFGIILENLSKIYSAQVNNELLTLEPVIPFSLYAKEVLENSKGDEYKQTEEYWLNQYKDEVPVLDIPTDTVRPIVRTFKSQRSDFTVSNEMIENVKSLGAKSKASLVSTLIAAFETYLHLLTKQSTIVLGLPASGQSATGNYELVGHCVNLLPLKSKPNGDLSFLEYLSKRKSEILDDYDHQQFTFGTLLQKLNIARDSSRVPLVPIVFNIDMGMNANVSFSGLKHTLSSDPRSYENFEIFLNITGSEQALTFEWSYNTHLFKESSIQRMMTQFEGLLEQVVSNSHIKIKEILIQESGPINPINEWNNSTKSAYPKNKTVSEFINEAAIKHPTKTAVYFEDEELSYTRLNQQSNQLAHYLLSLGVKKGDIVALAVDRSPQMIVALLGIMKSGAAYLPLDPQYPKSRIEFMLQDSAAKYVILSRQYHSTFQSDASPLIIDDLCSKLSEQPSHFPAIDIQGIDLAYILYTSGSTGKPKGVQIEHHSLTNLVLSIQKQPGIKSDDKLLAITTISFDIAANEIYLPLIVGACIYLVDSKTAKDGSQLLQLVREKEISIMQATPTTWRMMLASGWNKRLPLKMICTGEGLPKDLVEDLREKVTEIWNGYGPSETTIWSSIKQLTKEDEIITIGKPIDNTQIYILDEFKQSIPIGSSGEIYIGGDGLARGYLNRPELTLEKFVSNPFAKELSSKMYATGDLGYYLENGEIICLGRIDAQVKIRGHRIELEEIEYNLIQQPGIKNAVVTSQGDAPDNQYLLAHIIPDENNQEEWLSLWDEIYIEGIEKERHLSIEQQDLDIAIVNNDEVDIIEHSTEWKTESLKRLKALNARKILELGAGGGHLMFELAQKASRYVATDYSEVAINKLKEKLRVNPEKWKHVNAFVASADDHRMVDGSNFDLILLHSVIQYFPSVSYLFDVIQKSISLLTDGGCLFIGDSQTAEAAYMHIAHEQLKYVDNKASVKDLKEIINYRIKQQNELSINPDFFYFLPRLFPSITAVDIQLRKGEYLNEGTKSHYDVWIYKGNSAPKVVESDVIGDWHERLPPEWIEELLLSNQQKVVQIKNINNQRVDKDFAIVQAINQLEEDTSVKELKNYLPSIQRSKSINPSQIWELGERLGFKTHLRWANDGANGKLEAIFIPHNIVGCIPSQPSEIVIKSENHYLSIGKEQIDVIDLPDHQIQTWKKGLKSVLPDYMVPAQYIALNRFPTTNNGKIDRKNLPLPEKIANTKGFIAPRNEIEKEIAEIWSEFLSVKEISINSNFFESGGHSLTAVRVMLAIEKKFGQKLAISTLFENSTIEKLAKLITGEKKRSKWESLVSIKSTGSKTPIYLVHGGGYNVLTFAAFSKYMDPEQPIYALQGLGLYDKSKLLHSIEEIAQYYISEIQEIDPIGPYALGGYSSGGILAYEMARQLLEKGKEVHLLAMLDTSYNVKNTQRLNNTIQKIAHLLNKSVFYCRSLLKHPKQTLKYLRRTYLLTPNLLSHEPISYEEEINLCYDIAFKKYQISPLDIKVDLFKAKRRVYYLNDSEYYGWNRYATKGVEVHDVDGEHNTFILSPYEREFARTFQAVIDSNTGSRGF